MSGIVSLSMLSPACQVFLHELCVSPNCEDYCHDTDDLLPLVLSPEDEDAAELEYDRRAERRADR